MGDVLNLKGWQETNKAFEPFREAPHNVPVSCCFAMLSETDSEADKDPKSLSGSHLGFPFHSVNSSTPVSRSVASAGERVEAVASKCFQWSSHLITWILPLVNFSGLKSMDYF